MEFHPTLIFWTVIVVKIKIVPHSKNVTDVNFTLYLHIIHLKVIYEGRSYELPTTLQLIVHDTFHVYRIRTTNLIIQSQSKRQRIL